MSKVLGIEALAGIRDWVKSEDDAVKAELQAQIGSPLVASTVAGMTDQTKVYVYTGSETGYTAGNWYYYNGSAWTSGGVYNSTALETDTTLTIAGMAADAKATGDEITHVKQDISVREPIPIYQGVLNNNAQLFTRSDLLGASFLYYNFDVPESKYGYIELFNSNNVRIDYIGKGSSSSGALHYEGLYEIPDTLSYAKFTTNADANTCTADCIGAYPTKEFNKSTQEANAVSSVYKEEEKYNVSPYAIRTNGGNVTVSYGFSVRNIHLNAGETVVIIANGYNLTIYDWDVYGRFVGNTKIGNSVIVYTASSECFISCNIIAQDTSVTFNNDYISRSGTRIYSDHKTNIKVNSGQVVMRTYIPATQHGEDKYVRIPSAKIMPNRDVLVAYEVRDSLSDYSTSFLGYSIIRNGSIISHGAIASKESGEIRQFNPQIYTLSNGNILILWTSNNENDVCTIHYAISEDYGVTWCNALSLSGTVVSNNNILTAPANGVWANGKILLPVYITSGVFDLSTVRSGIMSLDPTAMTHSEKFITGATGLNECNVFLNGNTAILTARQEAGGTPGVYRHIFIINSDLSNDFTELTNFYITSAYREVCQESYFKTSSALYICMANRNSVGIKLYASDDLSRTYTELVQLVDVYCLGYSCIDIVDNTIAICTEGADQKNTEGKYIFADTVVIGNTV